MGFAGFLDFSEQGDVRYQRTEVRNCYKADIKEEEYVCAFRKKPN